ncbi:ABC transporter permease subunit [Paenisporosarcina indica]|uniref:ABC transporter permease subunit n=1 Tax=Paenisporosarcina indica TaxID=650093 RepID=UPI00094FB6BF|nr:ABC transporter permease subunit [Paenisporosarcina indica]
MSSIFGVMTRFVYVVIGIILLSAFVGLFTNGIQIEFTLFVNNVIEIVKSLIFPENLIVLGPTKHEFSIFINFWDYYYYSLIIFLSALIISIITGVLITYIMILLPQKLNNFVSKCVSFSESLPDLFIIMVIQFSVIYYYKQTGTLLFPVAGSSQDNTYILPIITLALIPSFMIFRINLHLFNEEWKKSYVELARSKGFNKTDIFFSHVLRNMAPSIFSHSKTIVLYLLSSMVIFERLFNIHGIMTYMTSYPIPNIIAFTLIMFFIPIFVLYALITTLIEKNTGQRLEW